MIYFLLSRRLGFPSGSDGKESAGQCGRPGFYPWIGKISWRRKGQPAPVFLPGESHRRRSLGLQSMGCKESGMTEELILKCLSGAEQPLCHVGLIYMFGYGSHISEPPALMTVLRTGPLPHTGMSCLREHGPLASD